MVQLPKVTINVRLSEIASFLGCSFVGEDLLLDGFNLSNREIEADCVISYCAAEKYFRKAKKNNKVKALIVPPGLFEILSDEDKVAFSFIIIDNPEWSFYRAYIDIVNKFDLKSSYESIIPEDAVIQPGAVVENGVVLGHNVVVGFNSVIKAGTIIGDNVTIGCCSVIGGEGFQLIKDNTGRSQLIPHIGRTYLGDNVTIGDGSIISRSLFEGYTCIMDNVKIDNHVHIGHNCYVGKNSVITGHSAMSGSSSIGENVWIAPKCLIMNRVHVGDGAFVCSYSFVCVDVKPGLKVGGNPAQRIKEY